MAMNRIWADLGAGVLAALIVAGAAVAGANMALGAHPWWAVKSGVIGAVIGLAIFAVLRGLRLPQRTMLAFGVLSLLAAGASAFYGKQVFVASFGENALAGRFWVFGWFGASAAACLCLAAIFSSVRR